MSPQDPDETIEAPFFAEVFGEPNDAPAELEPERPDPVELALHPRPE